MKNDLACEHGRLKRQCNECDLEEENTQLKARIARLADMRHHVTPTVINGKAEYVHISEISKYINKVLNETPQQSLVEHDCSNIEKAIFDTAKMFAPENTTYASVAIFAKEYAEQLRNSVKDGND